MHKYARLIKSEIVPQQTYSLSSSPSPPMTVSKSFYLAFNARSTNFYYQARPTTPKFV